MPETADAGGRRDRWDHRMFVNHRTFARCRTFARPWTIVPCTALQGHHGTCIQPKKYGNGTAAGQGQYLGIETDTDALDSSRDSAGARFDKVHHFSLLLRRFTVQPREMPEQHMPGQQFGSKKYHSNYWRASVSVSSPLHALGSWSRLSTID